MQYLRLFTACLVVFVHAMITFIPGRFILPRIEKYQKYRVIGSSSKERDYLRQDLWGLEGEVYTVSGIDYELERPG